MCLALNYETEQRTVQARFSTVLKILPQGGVGVGCGGEVGGRLVVLWQEKDHGRHTLEQIRQIDFNPLCVVHVSFCGLTKGLSPKICLLGVCVIINKRSFEPFCV